MAELNKIEKAELDKVVNQQKELNEVLTQIGILESQKHGLLHKIAELNKDINETKSELEDKYGKVNIDLKDGSYTEIKEEE
jgi:uncharacterized protein YoxC